MESPRVAMLIDHFYPLLEGAGLQALRLSRELVAQSVPVMVVTRRIRPESSPHEVLDGLRIFRLPPSGPRTHLKTLMQIFPAAWFLIRHRHDYDLLHVHDVRSLFICGLIVCLITRKPLVVKVPTHGDVSRRASRSTRLSLYSRVLRGLILPYWLWGRLLKQASAWIAISREIEQELADMGLAERVAAIPNGIETAHFHPVSSAPEKQELRQRLGLKADAFYIISHGRIAQRKRLDILILAFAAIVKERPDARLLLPGAWADAALEARLRGLIEGQGLAESVLFPGAVENAHDYLRASDVFVLASEREGMPNALLEAMACGLPSVGSRIGGVEDLIRNGENGLLVPPADVDALTEVLRLLVQDAALRARLGDAATQSAVAYSMEAVAGAYRALYRRLLLA